MSMSENMNVSFFLPSLRGGGAERMMVNLAKELVYKGYNVEIVLAKKEGPYVDEVPNTIPIVDLAASRVLFALPALTRYLKKRNPQVLLSALHYANIVALLAKKIAGVSTRVVVSERNHLSSTIKNTNNFKDKL